MTVMARFFLPARLYSYVHESLLSAFFPRGPALRPEAIDGRETSRTGQKTHQDTALPSMPRFQAERPIVSSFPRPLGPV